MFDCFPGWGSWLHKKTKPFGISLLHCVYSAVGIWVSEYIYIYTLERSESAQERRIALYKSDQ